MYFVIFLSYFTTVFGSLIKELLDTVLYKVIILIGKPRTVPPFFLIV